MLLWVFMQVALFQYSIPYGSIWSSLINQKYTLQPVLPTGPQTLPQPVLHTVRSCASSFISRYHIITLRSSSRCLCLLSCLPFTFSLPLFPSSSRYLRLLVCLPVTSSLNFSHHPIAVNVYFFVFPSHFLISFHHPVVAHVYFFVFPSLLPYPFPIIQ